MIAYQITAFFDDDSSIPVSLMYTLEAAQREVYRQFGTRCVEKISETEFHFTLGDKIEILTCKKNFA
jgi:hypothetical protein